MKKPLAVVDTNLFISALILPKSKPGQMLTLLKRHTFTLGTSEAMLKELQMVLKRPKYEEKYKITFTDKDNLLLYMRRMAHIVSTLRKPSIVLRDPKDLIILATALDSTADYLVTGDKDIHAIKSDERLGTLRIVTVDEFLTLLHP